MHGEIPVCNAREHQLLALEDWFECGVGRHVLSAEQAVLDARLPGLFGFHLMQLGISRRVRLFGASAVRHKFQLSQLPGAANIGALSEPEQLPIESETIDVALLHHVLEYSASPHKLLRESARVVVPHGSLIVIGFNPWSLFGAWSVPGRRFGHAVWRSRMLGARRVADWLALLDFAIEDIQYRVHGPPIDHAPTLARLTAVDRVAAAWSLPGGAVYVIHARKQVARLLPVRNLRWRTPRLAGVSLVAPRARNTTLH